MTRPAWRGRRVFVTGHTGFKGGWLTLWLRKLGAQVHGFALAPETSPSLCECARVEDGLVSTRADLRDGAAVRAAMAAAEPEVVFHLAAQPLVRRSYADPVGTFASNVMGTVHVLDAIRAVPSVRAAVIITTDKVYENREWPWGYREVDALGGHDPYSSSKACAELAVAAFRRSFLEAGGRRIGVATARAGNVIGGGDWAEDRLVPDAVRALSAGGAVSIRNPAAVRPWQHVLEPLLGYLQLAERLVDGPALASAAFNFGPNADGVCDVAGVMDQVCRLWGGGAHWQHDGGTHPHEAHSLTLDASQARNLLGWAPRLPLATALEWTVRWYRELHSGADARALVEADIDRFGELG